MRNTILVDIDHTLSNAFHRDGMIGTTSWDDYHLAGVQDEPLHDIVNLINSLHKTYYIVGVTARPEKWRRITNDWLYKNKIHLDELLMRPNEAFHPAPEIKVSLAAQRFHPANLKDEIAFLLEDRDDVSAAFRDLGVTVLQVHGRRD